MSEELDLLTHCFRCKRPVRREEDRRWARINIVHVMEDGSTRKGCPERPSWMDPDSSESKTKSTSSTHNKRKGASKMIQNRVFDMSATAVLRWMGRDGMTHEQAAAFLDSKGVKLNPVTVKGHLSDGAHGKGDTARSGRSFPSLTKEQVGEIHAFKTKATKSAPAPAKKTTAKKVAKKKTTPVAKAAKRTKKTTTKKTSKKK